MKRLIPVLAAAFVACLPVLASFGGGHAQERMGSLAKWRRRGTADFNGRWQIPDRGFVPGRGRNLRRQSGSGERRRALAAQALYHHIIGMSAGQTSVYAMDQQGRQIAAIDLSIGRDIGELQQILRAAMPAAAITARTVNDTIILTGVVDSAEEAQRADDIAKGFVQRVYGGGPPGAPGGTSDGLVTHRWFYRCDRPASLAAWARKPALCLAGQSGGSQGLQRAGRLGPGLRSRQRN